jgi:hypothetical protein
MSTQTMYTASTVRKSALLRAYPHMNGNLTNNTTPDGKSRTHSFELNVEKRFAKGFNLNFGYTALSGARRLLLLRMGSGTVVETSNKRPSAADIGTAVFEFPFGKAKRLGECRQGAQLRHRRLADGVHLRLSAGRCSMWGNVFYYGSDIKRHHQGRQDLGQMVQHG